LLCLDLPLDLLGGVEGLDLGACLEVFLLLEEDLVGAFFASEPPLLGAGFVVLEVDAVLGVVLLGVLVGVDRLVLLAVLGEGPGEVVPLELDVVLVLVVVVLGLAVLGEALVLLLLLFAAILSTDRMILCLTELGIVLVLLLLLVLSIGVVLLGATDA
jgi:hypothetical protein